MVPRIVGVDRHVPPADDVEALLGRDLLDPATGLGDLLLVAGQERGPDGVAPALGQLEARLADDLAQEGVGDLHQDAGAVARVDLGTGRTPVVQVAQCGEGLGHDVVAGLSRHRRDEGNATGVVLVARVVETLGRRERVRVRHQCSPVVFVWGSAPRQVHRRWGARDVSGPRGGALRLPPGDMTTTRVSRRWTPSRRRSSSLDSSCGSASSADRSRPRRASLGRLSDSSSSGCGPRPSR